MDNHCKDRLHLFVTVFMRDTKALKAKGAAVALKLKPLENARLGFGGPVPSETSKSSSALAVHLNAKRSRRATLSSWNEGLLAVLTPPSTNCPSSTSSLPLFGSGADAKKRFPEDASGEIPVKGLDLLDRLLVTHVPSVTFSSALAGRLASSINARNLPCSADTIDSNFSTNGGNAGSLS